MIIDLEVARTILVSLVSRLGTDAAKNILQRGKSVTIPVSLLEDVIRLQVKESEERARMVEAFHEAIRVLEGARSILFVEAPQPSLTIPRQLLPEVTIVEGEILPSDQTASVSLATQVTEQRLAQPERLEEAGQSPLAQEFEARMRAAYPGFPLEFK